MRVLLIGDFHVPDRSREIQLTVKNHVYTQFTKHAFDLVLCTGDLTKVDVVMPYLGLLGVESCIVQGNMDYDSRNAIGFARKRVFSVAKWLAGGENLVIEMVHGHQVHPRGDSEGLARIARESGAAVLVSGHTHAASSMIHEGKSGEPDVLLLNPGSATGAWSFVASGKPSFMVMEIDTASVPGEFTIVVITHELGSDGWTKARDTFKVAGAKIHKTD